MSAHLDPRPPPAGIPGGQVEVGHPRHGAHRRSPRELTMTSSTIDMPDRAVLVDVLGSDHIIGVWDHAGIVISSYANGIDNAPTAMAAVEVQLVSAASFRMRATVKLEWDSPDDPVSGESLAARALRAALNVATYHPWSPPGDFTVYGDDAAMSFLLGPPSCSTRADEAAVTMGGPR